MLKILINNSEICKSTLMILVINLGGKYYEKE